MANNNEKGSGTSLATLGKDMGTPFTVVFAVILIIGIALLAYANIAGERIGAAALQTYALSRTGLGLILLPFCLLFIRFAVKTYKDAQKAPAEAKPKKSGKKNANEDTPMGNVLVFAVFALLIAVLVYSITIQPLANVSADATDGPKRLTGTITDVAVNTSTLTSGGYDVKFTADDGTAYTIPIRTKDAQALQDQLFSLGYSDIDDASATVELYQRTNALAKVTLA